MVRSREFKYARLSGKAEAQWIPSLAGALKRFERPGRITGKTHKTKYWVPSTLNGWSYDAPPHDAPANMPAEVNEAVQGEAFAHATSVHSSTAAQPGGDGLYADHPDEAALSQMLPDDVFDTCSMAQQDYDCAQAIQVVQPLQDAEMEDGQHANEADFGVVPPIELSDSDDSDTEDLIMLSNEQNLAAFRVDWQTAVVTPYLVDAFNELFEDRNKMDHTALIALQEITSVIASQVGLQLFSQLDDPEGVNPLAVHIIGRSSSVLDLCLGITVVSYACLRQLLPIVFICKFPV